MLGEEYRGAKIPLLKDTLEYYGKNTHWVLEIKQSGIELEVLEMVSQLSLLDTVTFTSFNFTTLENIKTQFPTAMLGWLTSDSSEESIDKTVEAGFNQICLPALALSPELVSAANKRGLEVRAWQVKDTAAMMSAIQAGVNGMTVDFPHLLLTALNRD